MPAKIHLDTDSSTAPLEFFYDGSGRIDTGHRTYGDVRESVHRTKRHSETQVADSHRRRRSGAGGCTVNAHGAIAVTAAAPDPVLA